MKIATLQEMQTQFAMKLSENVYKDRETVIIADNDIDGLAAAIIMKIYLNHHYPQLKTWIYADEKKRGYQLLNEFKWQEHKDSLTFVVDTGESYSFGKAAQGDIATFVIDHHHSFDDNDFRVSATYECNSHNSFRENLSASQMAGMLVSRFFRQNSEEYRTIKVLQILGALGDSIDLKYATSREMLLEVMEIVHSGKSEIVNYLNDAWNSLGLYTNIADLSIKDLKNRITKAVNDKSSCKQIIEYLSKPTADKAYDLVKLVQERDLRRQALFEKLRGSVEQSQFDNDCIVVQFNTQETIMMGDFGAIVGMLSAELNKPVYAISSAYRGNDSVITFRCPHSTSEEDKRLYRQTVERWLTNSASGHSGAWSGNIKNGAIPYICGAIAKLQNKQKGGFCAEDISNTESCHKLLKFWKKKKVQEALLP